MQQQQQQQQQQLQPQRQQRQRQRRQQYPSCSQPSSSAPAPSSSTSTAVRLLPRPTLSSDALPSLASTTPAAAAHAHVHAHRVHDVASPMSVAAVPTPPPPTPASGTPSGTASASASASAPAAATASVTAGASTPTPTPKPAPTSTPTSTGEPLQQPVKKRNKGKQPKWRDLDSLAAVMCILELSKVPGMAANTGGIGSGSTGGAAASVTGSTGTGGTKQRRVDFHNQLKLEFDQRAPRLSVTDARILEIWHSRSGRSIAEQGNKAIVACRRLKAVFDSIRNAHLDDATRMRCAIGLFNEVVNESQFGDMMSNRNYFIGKPFPYPLTFQWLSENTKELLVEQLVPSVDVNSVNNINSVNNNNNNTNNNRDNNEHVVNEYDQQENPHPPAPPPQPLRQQAPAPTIKSDDDAKLIDTHEDQQIHITNMNGGRRRSATLRPSTNAPVTSGRNDDDEVNDGDNDDNNNTNAASPSQHSASDKSMKTSPAKAASAREDNKDGHHGTRMFQLAMRAFKEASMASTRASDRRAKLQTDLAERYLQMRKKADEVEALKVLFDDDSEESKQYKKILQRRRLRELMRADEQEAREEREEREGIGLRKKRKAGNHRDAHGSQQPMECAANGNSPDVMFTFE